MKYLILGLEIMNVGQYYINSNCNWDALRALSCIPQVSKFMLPINIFKNSFYNNAIMKHYESYAVDRAPINILLISFCAT